MYLRPTDDEAAITEMFGTFFGAEATIERVRAAELRGDDPDLWMRSCETGAPGMALPIAAGGGGASLADAAIVATLVGRHIAPIPLIEHIAASRAIALADPGHPSLAHLADGSKVATLALNGHRLVPAGSVASVVVAADEAGSGLVVAESEPARSPASNTANLPLADRDLENAVALAPTGWRRAVAEWQALMATALCGIGSRAVEIGVAYVKDRHQFGVPVGSFQSVQHGLATAVSGVDGATLLASRAVHSLDTDGPDASTMASMAFLFAAEAAQAATAAALQYHGGYGYAEEYDIQLYYRRARGWALQYGDPAAEYQRLAEDLLPRAEVA